MHFSDSPSPLELDLGVGDRGLGLVNLDVYSKPTHAQEQGVETIDNTHRSIYHFESVQYMTNGCS